MLPELKDPELGTRAMLDSALVVAYLVAIMSVPLPARFDLVR